MRRSYSGGAKGTVSTVGIDEVALSITAASLVNWPSGSGGPFTMTIDDGEVNEETVLCTSYSGVTITIAQRGYAGTTAVAHSPGATLKHTGSAVDFDEANEHVNKTLAVHGLTVPDGPLVAETKTQTLRNKTIDGLLNTLTNIPQSSVTGLVTALSVASTTATDLFNHVASIAAHGATGSVVGTSNPQTLINKTLNAPLIQSGLIDSTSQINGFSAGLYSDAVFGGYTPYTPTWFATGLVMGTAVSTGRWKKIGNQVHVRVRLAMGGGMTLPVGGPTPLTFSIPSAFTIDSSIGHYGTAVFWRIGVNIWYGSCFGYGGGNNVGISVHTDAAGAAGLVTATNPFPWAPGDYLDADIWLEVQ